MVSVTLRDAGGWGVGQIWDVGGTGEAMGCGQSGGIRHGGQQVRGFRTMSRWVGESRCRYGGENGYIVKVG